MAETLKSTQIYLNQKAGNTEPYRTEQECLNQLAGTNGWTAQDAANQYAGTKGLSVQGALNVKVGNYTGNLYSKQIAASKL